MSIPTSKSKTQLAYASNSLSKILGSTKAVNKPKTKSNNTNQSNDLNKPKLSNKNSAGNIYDSIMGQIDTTQQDYIKSLIVKNQKETLKSQKQSQKELHKGLKQNHQQKKTTVSIKSPKQQTTSQKGSMTNLHQRTKSQNNLILSQSQVDIETEKLIKVEVEKQNNQIRTVSQQAQNSIATSQVKPVVDKKDSSKKQQFSTTFPQNQKNQSKNISSSNPIIEALNNTSSSFAKKLEAFQLQYPTEERQERSTHKKVGLKLVGDYFSCQTSPKNVAKHIYTQQVIVTTKPQEIYYSSANKNDRHQSTKISPISSNKNNSTAKNNAKKINQNEQAIPTNFLNCLDEYLEALTQNQSDGQENNRPSNGSYKMRRNNSNKMKQFPISKGLTHPFVLDKEDDEEETIVLQSINYQNALHNKIGQQKSLPLVQQQKLIKLLQKEKKKVQQLQSFIERINQQRLKLKKKNQKMRSHMEEMVNQLKIQDSALTQERRQRRKLQQVVKDFQSKIRGISRGKDNKKRRGSMEQDQRLQRKTIYGIQSMGNSIHYGQPIQNFYCQQQKMMMQQDMPSRKMQKPSKKGSKNRFSSVINNMTQDYSRNVLNNIESDQLDNYYPDNRMQANNYSNNRTQKIQKIISSFDLENQDEEEMMVYGRPSQMRNSMKNNLHVNPPVSCKNSYMNSSLPGDRQVKSRPMTPKLIQDLFKGSTNKDKKKSKNSSQFIQQQYLSNGRGKGNDYDESSSQQQFIPEYIRQHQHGYNNNNGNNRHIDCSEQEEQEQDSQFNPTLVNSEQDDVEEQEEYDEQRQYNNHQQYNQHQRYANYHNKQNNDIVIRMR